MLLRVVGGSVKRLALEGEDVDVAPPEQWYWEVLRACPALEAFEMRRLDVGSLDIFSGAFDRGVTSINQLSLQLTGPDTAQVSTLLSDLADTDKPIARHLKTLLIKIQAPNDDVAVA
jgi:hypothetical protein